MAEEALVRIVLADQVRERLLEGILDGSYPPDSRIVETAVAKELGTSQAPVREALHSLAALGVVEIVPFRGARVRKLQPEELVEAYVVRSTIEALAAKLAVPRMTGADLHELAGFADKMQAAAKAGNGRTVAEYDVRFHERIVELSGNRALARVWRSLEPFSRTYLTLVMPGADPQWSAGLHTPILDAMRRRDADAVVRAVEAHFTEVSQVLASRLEAPDAAAGKAAKTKPAGAVRPRPASARATSRGRRGR